MFRKLKSNRGASAITLAIFVVILISIFIVSSMNQIGNQMKSTRNRNENIELKYVAEAGTEEIIADIYKQIEEKTEEKIEEFETKNNAIIQYDSNRSINTTNVKLNSKDNYLISHLDTAAKMYLNISNDIRATDAVLANEIVEKIYKPIVKNGYELDGVTLTLIGWAKEAQNGNEKALDLVIKKIGFNDNTDITPQYNGNDENITNRPVTSGIKKDIELTSNKISNQCKIEFKKAEYMLNLALYTATHAKYDHQSHEVEIGNLNDFVFNYLDKTVKDGMEDAFKEAGKTDSTVAQKISFLQQKVFILAQNVSYIITGHSTREQVIVNINNVINEIVSMQVELVKKNMESTAILLEKTKRQLIEVKCRLGNVNLGGNEVTPEEPEPPIEPPTSDDQNTIIIPIIVPKENYNNVSIDKDKTYTLMKNINFELKIELELINPSNSIKNQKIYSINIDESYLSEHVAVNVTSKGKNKNKEKYNMESTIKFNIKDVGKVTRKPSYEILQWNN